MPIDHAFISNDVKTLIPDLIEEYNLSNYEALQIALKAEFNGMFKRAMVLTSEDKYPTAIESISIRLVDVVESIDRISNLS